MGAQLAEVFRAHFDNKIPQPPVQAPVEKFKNSMNG
jgi:hypothetical protein